MNRAIDPDGLKDVSNPERARSLGSDKMTTAEFYRDEAARCLLRAEKSTTEERAAKWQARAHEYLRLTAELEAAEQSPSRH